MSDLVKRLRKGDLHGDCKRDRCMCDIMDEAAARIEQATGKIEVTKVRIIKQAETISFLDCENDQLRAVLRNIMEMTEAKTTTAVEPVNTTAIHALACRALKEVNNDR